MTSASDQPIAIPISTASLTIFDVKQLYSVFSQINLSQACNIDLAKVEQIDSSGVQLLLAFANACAQANGKLTLLNATSSLLDCLDYFNCRFLIEDYKG